MFRPLFFINIRIKYNPNMIYDLCEMLRTTWSWWFAIIWSWHFFDIILHSMKLVIALQVPLILPIIKNILLTIRPIWITIEWLMYKWTEQVFFFWKETIRQLRDSYFNLSTRKDNQEWKVQRHWQYLDTNKNIE